MCIRDRNTPDCFRRQSTSVVLPWSTWAIIAILRNEVISDMGGVTFVSVDAHIYEVVLFGYGRL